MTVRLRSLVFVLTIVISVFFSTAHATMWPSIVGGVEATPHEFPFMVTLQGEYQNHMCSGSLIASNWVLTAAHCVDGGAPVRFVRLGLHSLTDMTTVETQSIQRIIIHPNYSRSKQSWDFALIQLKSDVKRSAPIEIFRNKIEVSNESQNQTMATVAGWGYISERSYDVSDVLRKVQVPLISQERCERYYPQSINESMLCAGLQLGGKDSCQGDSGGPLFVSKIDGGYQLIGVVSWGEGCARPGAPGVYARVSSVLEWIDSYLIE